MSTSCSVLSPHTGAPVELVGDQFDVLEMQISEQVDKTIPDGAGQSKFILKNLHYYSGHPHLARFYEPSKPSARNRLLERNRKIRSFILKVMEYDQDKTLLILTNNPPPYPIDLQGKDVSPKYFPRELLAKDAQQLRRPTETLPLPLMPQEKMSRSLLKPVFPVTLMGHPAPKQQQWFRLRSAGPTSKAKWEPLTLASLQEEKPTKTAPGENTFRQGRAPQWIIKKAMNIT
ncbi:testis-specific gene 13 protein [Echinops telfairi]|uniref:Testis-specific gene 13 protein n=1 Tax=Echinops telfairi TaxID=9371 RepID=A0ABM0IUC6_ECHTE|nr:testis-specific gene 13 protein [Echinops telfairi]